VARRSAVVKHTSTTYRRREMQYTTRSVVPH